MAPDSLNELSVTIGKLLGGVETLTRTAGEDRMAAAQYRTDMRREMKEQSGTLGAITGEVKGLKDNVTFMQKDIDALQRDVSEYRTHRDQFMGAAKLGKMLWAVLIAVSGLVGAAVSTLVSALIGGPR